MKTAGKAANEWRDRKIKEGSHARLTAKTMRIDVYERLQTNWKQSGMKWDDFIVMLLNNQDDGK